MDAHLHPDISSSRVRRISSAIWLFFACLGLGGLLLHTEVGDRWVHASYDLLFRFSTRAVPQQVVIIRMDNASFEHFRQTRGQPWDRSIHVPLLRRLADDAAALVVFDVAFRTPGDPATDASLAEAMQRQGRVVLMARLLTQEHQEVEGVRPWLPAEPFLSACGQRWGVAWFDPDRDGAVRRHWPYPSPGPFPSLAATAAQTLGAQVPGALSYQWLRYYSQPGPWVSLSHSAALQQPPGFYQGRIVLIGQEAETPFPDGEEDEFVVPHTGWTRTAVSGVEIIATQMLNLLNRDGLVRIPRWLEWLMLVAGAAFSVTLLLFSRPGWCLLAALLISLGAGLLGLLLAHHTSWWCPWALCSGAQLPLALVWGLIVSARSGKAIIISAEDAIDIISTPDYERMEPPLGHGSFGQVWLVRNAVGQWQALKLIRESTFVSNPAMCHIEFKGLVHYKPISDRHVGLLKIDFISRQRRGGYFYYVMELADPVTPGWQGDPADYRPRDLRAEIDRSVAGRIPIRVAIDWIVRLSEALDFLHSQGLTHRDIKPSNIVFVNGQPKLADLGLVTNTRPAGEETAWAGTPGYMPPPPEPPGTIQADVFGLGMVIFVITTGTAPVAPERLAAALEQHCHGEEAAALRPVILKACAHHRLQRFTSARELRAGLLDARTRIRGGTEPSMPTSRG